MHASPHSDLNPDAGFSAPAEPAAALSAAIDLLWARFLPDIRNRADLLSAAAADCVCAPLPAVQREAAHAAAHKLAGTLGTFNLARGTELARELELAFAGQMEPDPALASHLASVAAELRTIIDSRK